ncbi:MAG: hypothetical protein JSU82_06880, partial [Rhodospirillales bacterium]
MKLIEERDGLVWVVDRFDVIRWISLSDRRREYRHCHGRDGRSRSYVIAAIVARRRRSIALAGTAAAGIAAAAIAAAAIAAAAIAAAAIAAAAIAAAAIAAAAIAAAAIAAAAIAAAA